MLPVSEAQSSYPDVWGTLEWRRGSLPTVTNSIFWGNGSDVFVCDSGGHPDQNIAQLEYCSFIIGFCCMVQQASGKGNIHDDPMFVTGPMGEYYLHPDSPCIDAGSQSASAAGLSGRTTQTDGTPDTGTVDMGFHYPIP